MPGQTAPPQVDRKGQPYYTRFARGAGLVVYVTEWATTRVAPTMDERPGGFMRRSHEPTQGDRLPGQGDRKGRPYYTTGAHAGRAW